MIDLAGAGDLPAMTFGFVLMLARVAGALALMPGLGESTPPAMLRAGLVLSLTLLLLPARLPALPTVPDTGIEAGAMLIAESVTGLWFGWLARLIVLALPVSGQIMAHMMGITNVLQPGGELGAQTTAMARLFDLAAPLLILTTGLYQWPLSALDRLYDVVPAGRLVPAGDGLSVVITAVAASWTLALRLAAPFVLAALVWHLATGLMARFLPRLQVYFVAVPGQILGGLALLAAVAVPLLAAWIEATRTGLGLLPGGG